MKKLFWKIHRKTQAIASFLSKVLGLALQIYTEKGTIAGAFLYINQAQENDVFS